MKFDDIELKEKGRPKTPSTRYEKMSPEARERHKNRVNIYVKNNREKNRKWAKIAYWRRKKKAFEILGKKCVKCGYSDARALCINHINGQGKDKSTGSKLYNQVIKGEVTKKDVEVLCMNCNHIYEYERKNYKLP